MMNQTKNQKLLTPGRIVIVVFFGIMLILPLFITSNYITTILVNCMAFALSLIHI